MATPDTLPPSGSTDTAARHRETARRALEEVCSGRGLAAVEEVYSPLFVDHVNFPDLRFQVAEQVVERDRVASRWMLHGTHRGRRVQLRGIVISRFEDGKIVEDWAASDTMELARQLGVWRSLLLLLRHGRLLRDQAREGQQ